MKKIKIFIASSAELNEDKQMFDLYFSDKNKLYRDRNIDFDQRTWMDFSSSLNEGRLQDRYNDYIRECDIVIFCSTHGWGAIPKKNWKWPMKYI